MAQLAQAGMRSGYVPCWLPGSSLASARPVISQPAHPAKQPVPTRSCSYAYKITAAKAPLASADSGLRTLASADSGLRTLASADSVLAHAGFSGLWRKHAGFSGLWRKHAGFSGLWRKHAGFSGLWLAHAGFSGLCACARWLQRTVA